MALLLIASVSGDRPWWTFLIQAVVFGLLTALVRYWIQTKRETVDTTFEGDTLRYAPPMRVLAYGTTLLFAVAAVLGTIYAKPDEAWTSLIFVGFVLMSAALLAETERVHHKLTSVGIDYRGLWKRHEVRWSELSEVHWSPGMKWFVLKTRSGITLRLSGLVGGLVAFAQKLEAHAPEVQMNDATRQVLEAARQGQLPSMYS